MGDAEEAACCLLLLAAVGMYWLYITNPGAFWGIITLIVVIAIMGIIYWASKKLEKPAPRVPKRPPSIPRSPSYSRSQLTIKCPNCGSENPKNFSFCGMCGMSLEEEGTRVYR